MSNQIKTKLTQAQIDRAANAIEEIAKTMRGSNTVKVGLPKNSNAYPDGTNTVMVGAVHEFGSPQNNVPERSFLRRTLNEKRNVYKSDFKKLAKKLARKETSKNKVMSLLGLKLQTDIKEKITDLKEPGLKSRDGNPLVDTGHLRRSIVYELGDD